MNIFGWLYVLGHALVLVFDDYVGFTLEDLFSPFASKYESSAMTSGIFALYVMLILLISSDLIRKLGRKWWRSIHILSFAGFALSLYHGIQFSGIADSPIAHHLYPATLSILLFLGLFRIFTKKEKLEGQEIKPKRV